MAGSVFAIYTACTTAALRGEDPQGRAVRRTGLLWQRAAECTGDPRVKRPAWQSERP